MVLSQRQTAISDKPQKLKGEGRLRQVSDGNEGFARFLNPHAVDRHLSQSCNFFPNMNTECHRIADQLRRAFQGQAWHGPSLRELLTNVNAEQANARPVKSAHSIWELVLHIDIWAKAALESLAGVPLPKLYGTEKDWPPVADSSAGAWQAATDRMFRTATELAQGIDGFADERLTDIVPGRQYDFYYLFHGVVQHSLYHGGQIAIVKKALA